MRKPLSWALAVTILFALPSALFSQDAQQKPASSSPIELKQSPAAEAAMRAYTQREQMDLAHQVVKTYYLKYLTQPMELQDIVNGLRTILEFQRVQPSPRLPAIVVRGSAEQVAAADKLIADLDRPKSAAAASNERVGENYRLDFTLTELDGGKKTATHAYSVIVQRARNYDDSRKTSFRSGSRVPIPVSHSTNPAVNTQFSYQDVGVNLDCRLYGPDDELTLNGNVELSNVVGAVDIGGLSEPVIRSARSEFTVAVAPGKTATVAGLDSVESQRRVDVEVVATKLK